MWPNPQGTVAKELRSSKFYKNSLIFNSFLPNVPFWPPGNIKRPLIFECLDVYVFDVFELDQPLQIVVSLDEKHVLTHI